MIKFTGGYGSCTWACAITIAISIFAPCFKYWCAKEEMVEEREKTALAAEEKI